MLVDVFYKYLIKDYCGENSGRPLGIEPAKDAVSRCRRIEAKLMIDLDVSLHGNVSELGKLIDLIENNKMLFEIDGNVARGIESIKNAARRYHDFVVFRVS